MRRNQGERPGLPNALARTEVSIPAVHEPSMRWPQA